MKASFVENKAVYEQLIVLSSSMHLSQNKWMAYQMNRLFFAQRGFIRSNLIYRDPRVLRSLILIGIITKKRTHYEIL